MNWKFVLFCLFLSLSFQPASLAKTAAAGAAPPIEIQGVDQRPLLELRDFTHARILEQNGKVIVSATLSASATKRFAKYTAHHVGSKLAISIRGKTVATPVVRDPITGGRCHIGPLDRADAQRLVRLINGKPAERR